MTALNRTLFRGLARRSNGAEPSGSADASLAMDNFEVPDQPFRFSNPIRPSG